MSYMPPIGFALLARCNLPSATCILIGALNILIINTFYGTKGWQVWFLAKRHIHATRIFSSQPRYYKLSLNLSFAYIAVIDIVLLMFTIRVHSKIQQRRMEKTHRLTRFGHLKYR